MLTPPSKNPLTTYTPSLLCSTIWRQVIYEAPQSILGSKTKKNGALSSNPDDPNCGQMKRSFLLGPLFLSERVPFSSSHQQDTYPWRSLGCFLRMKKLMAWLNNPMSLSLHNFACFLTVLIEALFHYLACTSLDTIIQDLWLHRIFPDFSPRQITTCTLCSAPIHSLSILLIFLAPNTTAETLPKYASQKLPYG